MGVWQKYVKLSDVGS